MAGKSNSPFPLMWIVMILTLILFISCDINSSKHYDKVKSLHEELRERDGSVFRLSEEIVDLCDEIEDSTLRDSIESKAQDIIDLVYEDYDYHIDGKLDDMEDEFFKDAYDYPQ